MTSSEPAATPPTAENTSMGTVNLMLPIGWATSFCCVTIGGVWVRKVAVLV
jgi:hypothetical protein